MAARGIKIQTRGNRHTGLFKDFVSGFALFVLPGADTRHLLAAGGIALLTVAVNFVVDWMLQKSSGLKE